MDKHNTKINIESRQKMGTKVNLLFPPPEQ